MKGQPRRLAADAPHGFGGREIDRTRPLRFRLNGRLVNGYAGDTVLTAALASGIDTATLDQGFALALDETMCPAVMPARSAGDASMALPMERTPAIDGFDLVTRGPRHNRLIGGVLGVFGRRNNALTPHFEIAGARSEPETTLVADVLVIGGGIAGLSAAEAAAAMGKTVILVERRPWLGGDSGYFGAVDEEDSPDLVIDRLRASLAGNDRVTILTRALVTNIAGDTALADQVVDNEDRPRLRVLGLSAARMVFATGTLQRLPMFAGNRLPGVLGVVAAYHRAERYGLWRGHTALFATQSNYPYRLALRAVDAGVMVQRVVDSRLNPQSRFIDFSKASGFNHGSGLHPFRAIALGDGAGVTVQFTGASGPKNDPFYTADQLIVSGNWQPDLSLWLMAGGNCQWSTAAARLEPSSARTHRIVAGSAAGYLGMTAAAASGRAAIAHLFGKPIPPIEDRVIGPGFETPDAVTPIAGEAIGAPTYLDGGPSGVFRPLPGRGKSAVRPLFEGALSLGIGDVAAGVDMGAIEGADAGIVAEERCRPLAEIIEGQWTGPDVPRPDAKAAPHFLVDRFGPKPIFALVAVNEQRVFETGALVYANTAPNDPAMALGVILGPAPGGRSGGLALLANGPSRRVDRFIVRESRGPVPARIVERYGAEPPAAVLTESK